MRKESLIKKLKEIGDFSDFYKSGGTAHFNKIYPKLLNSINYYSMNIGVYSINKKLIAKIIYLVKYNGNIENILYNKNVMIFDYKLKDFKIANINPAQKQWDVCKKELLEIKDFYSKEETISLLKNTYENYLGKSGNRKLLRDNKKLFLSVYKHTSEMDCLERNYKKFSLRLHILINNYDIYCHKHNRLNFWKIINGNFIIKCPICEPSYPSLYWFKKTYGEYWKKKYDEWKKEKRCSLEWYQKKYGNVLGKEKYDKLIYDRMLTLAKYKSWGFSKISQDLFWKIYNVLENKNNIYFKELNQEYVEWINKEYNYSHSVMLHDFKQDDKIIEYNGTYWHKNKEKDDIRYDILKKMGYKILVITSDEYSERNKDQNIIDKCVKFLEC